MSENGGSPKKGWFARFAELGPAWITAIAAVAGTVIAAAAFFVGHFTASPEPDNPSVAQTSPPAGHASGTTRPTPSRSSIQTTAANGKKLGSYTFQYPLSAQPYDVVLGASKPTQAQFNTAGIGDMSSTYPADVEILIPANGDKMLGLSSGTTPTYGSCTANTDFTSQAATTAGTVFCLSETAGRMLGKSCLE